MAGKCLKFSSLKSVIRNPTTWHHYSVAICKIAKIIICKIAKIIVLGQVQMYQVNTILYLIFLLIIHIFIENSVDPDQLP